MKVVKLPVTNKKIAVLLAILSIIMFNSDRSIAQQVQNVSNSASTNNLNNYRIEWSQLNLNDDQMKRIRELDAQWKSVEQIVRPKIIRDQQQLKNIMNNPNANEDQIRKLQKDIMVRQDQLRYEAIENFLSKRRILNQEQREKLHKIMPK